MDGLVILVSYFVMDLVRFYTYYLWNYALVMKYDLIGA